ncbi:hypothetical protein K7I13_04545 [Brucepastera parasyntrophica]|uniref:ATP-binding protein n=1 Tax=Brucepastera parasyntrophica TaxID=2880008 RepID=UPI00210E702D|nr:PAS domain-containing hybrid sensor histidine kinase/response regulator [Brucepastera parasyntrophica]ULQ60564.1 hypothetical protein K7I13_04545 [Brucepastera parasyntrophica]
MLYSLDTGIPFFLSAGYDIACPLANIIMLIYSYRKLGYRRDRHQALTMIIYLFAAIAVLLSRFWINQIYGWGCCIQFIGLLMMYNFALKYNASAINTINMAEYVYSSVNTPFLVLSQDGRILLANNSAAGFFRKNLRDLAGRDIRTFFLFNEEFKDFSKYPEGNTADHYDATALAGGAKCIIDITYIYDKYSELICTIFIINDMTGKIEMINELEDAKARAEAASLAKSTFLANTSHEIRTPMNAIVGMAELILREPVSPAVYEHALGIKQASANLLSIINDILDFSKIESGKLEIIPVQYMLASVLNDVINIIRMKVSEKPVMFVTNIDADLPNRLFGDEVRIRQILLNLLGNAIKYTSEGFISLSITGESKEDGTVFLRIDVADSGIGIKEEDTGKIFGNFTQVDVQKNKGIEGTGLGLAITKNLCLSMGGTITFVSTYGKGSIFTAILPQQISGSEKFASVDNPELKKVLVYEIREIYTQSLIQTFENLGVKASSVTMQSAFFEAMKADEYDFIFISQTLYEGAKKIVEKAHVRSRIVLMADYGAEPEGRNIRILYRPAHTLAAANILNEVEDKKNYVISDENDIRFIAPDARILLVDDIATNLKVAQGLMAPTGCILMYAKAGLNLLSWSGQTGMTLYSWII